MNNIYRPFGSVVPRSPESPSQDPPSGSSSPDNSSGAVRTTENLSRRNTNVTDPNKPVYSDDFSSEYGDFGVASGESDSEQYKQHR